VKKEGIKGLIVEIRFLKVGGGIIYQLERKHLVIILFVSALVIFGGGYKLASLNNENRDSGQDILMEWDSEGQEKSSVDTQGNPAGSEQASQETEIFVHVVGAVEKPGVYTLPAGARVVDAIEKAVPSPDARLDLINLAAPLPDGQQVVVLSEREYQEIIAAEGGNGVVASNRSLDAGMTFITAGNGGSTGQGLVNINTASQSELETLPGIGPALAGRIIDYRNNNKFLSPEDIKNVSGIGDKRFEEIKDKITVN
jgi:competence protein ComEA